MARKLELNSEQARILTTRVFISRSIGVFNLRDITTGWGISLATLHRYRSPEYRASSREHARRAYLTYRQSIQRGVCHRCEESLIGHARCSDCTILVHDDIETCQSCIDSRAQRTMRVYQLTA